MKKLIKRHWPTVMAVGLLAVFVLLVLGGILWEIAKVVFAYQLVFGHR